MTLNIGPSVLVNVENEGDEEKESSDSDDTSPDNDKESLKKSDDLRRLQGKDGDELSSSPTKKVIIYDDQRQRESDKLLTSQMGGAGTGESVINNNNHYNHKKPKLDKKEHKKKRALISRFYHSAKRKGAKSFASILGEDSLYLVTLGVLMGIFSFAIDFCIASLRNLHFYLFDMSGGIHLGLQYFVWVFYTLLLVMSSAAICHFVAPQAVGSGIPEMKTILRGVVLKEYLTLRTLIAKFMGLIMALGTGLPIGKEGPFVHIASMLARLLSYCAVSFKGIFENESRHSEMLAAACAVGVASTYGAPVGGVLFSIEVTSVFFPLRNYWRGFLATVCSAITFRLLAVWFEEQTTVLAFSATHFPSDYPFDPKELLVFALIGILCGFGGALFVWLHRKYVTLFLQNESIKKVLFKYPLIYPAIFVFILASIKCPMGYGHYFAGGLTPRDALGHLFSNFSWLDENATAQNNESQAVLAYWADGRNVFATLSLYCINMFWMTAVAITLPVPCGVFIPVFVTGAAFGRVFGEVMFLLFPHGVRTDGVVTKIVPGAYAIVGATAFSGAVTHALSTSVVVVEITGQILYILPTMLGVLLANAVCTRLQPSIYDSIIRLKKLPYIPAIPPVSSGIHNIYVHDIMIKDIKHISLESTYKELQDLLIEYSKLKTFPLVDRRSSLILLGSISRMQLLAAMDSQVGEWARRIEAQKRARIKPRTKSDDTDEQYHSSASKKINESEASAPKKSEDQSLAPDSEYSVSRKNSRFAVRRVRSHEQILDSDVKHMRSSIDSQKSPSPEELNARLQALSSPSEGSSTYNKLMSTVHAVGNYMNTLPNKFRQSLRRNVHPQLLVDQYDLGDEERIEWENQRLEERLNFDLIQIDPAPFQLVERTSLYRVHALFWLLGLNRAYVTSLGRLVGVVALRELRQALERTQSSASTDKQVIGGRKMNSLNSPNENAINRLPLPEKEPEMRRMNSVNPSMCLVPNQSETLRVPSTVALFPPITTLFHSTSPPISAKISPPSAKVSPPSAKVSPPSPPSLDKTKDVEDTLNTGNKVDSESSAVDNYIDQSSVSSKPDA